MIRYQEAIDTLKKSQFESHNGETVSQLDHALQAAYLAVRAGHSKEVVIASLFHDIGHFISKDSPEHMGELGANYRKEVAAQKLLEWGFSEKVAELVRNHVKVTRYLAACNRKYQSNLSGESLEILKNHGGPMSPTEMIEFASSPYFQECLQVRINDERARIPGLKVPGIEAYEETLRSL